MSPPLVIFRHGIAHDRAAPDCPADKERALTEKGERRTAAAARGLVAMGTAPRVILCSPYVRTRQTADIAAAAFGGVPVLPQEGLCPGGDMRALAMDLAGFEPVVVVGHNPELLELGSWLLAGAPHVGLVLKKAGALALGGPLIPGRAQLVWHLPPWVLRRVGDSPVTDAMGG